MANYTRLALILTSTNGSAPYREYARTTAVQFGLAYEEIRGSGALLRKLLYGPWDDEILVVEAGSKVRMEEFYSQIYKYSSWFTPGFFLPAQHAFSDRDRHTPCGLMIVIVRFAVGRISTCPVPLHAGHCNCRG